MYMLPQTIMKWEKEWEKSSSQNIFLIAFDGQSISYLQRKQFVSISVETTDEQILFLFFEFFVWISLFAFFTNCLIRIQMKCIRQIVVEHSNRVLLNEQFNLLDLEFIIAIGAN